MSIHETPIREPDEIRRFCSRKLQAVQVSEHFQAILGGCDRAGAKFFGENRRSPATNGTQ